MERGQELLHELVTLREKAANVACFLTRERVFLPTRVATVADGGITDVEYLRVFLPHRLRTL